MAYTAVDEFGDLRREKSEEEVVKLYNERVHKVILAWRNLHGLFENIQNDNVIRPLIDQGKPLVSTAAVVASRDPSEPEFEREKTKHEKKEIARTTLVVEDITDIERKDNQKEETGNFKIQDSSAFGTGEVLFPGRVPQVVKTEKKNIDCNSGKDISSLLDQRIPKQNMAKVQEISLSEADPEAHGDRDIRNEAEDLKKTPQVMKEISDRKVKERAAGKVKLIGALASELGDEVKMLKDQLHQVKLEKKQLEEKNLQNDKYIRSLIDERKQLLSKISKLSDELNALSAAHHFKTPEPHHRPASQATTSKVPNKRTTPTKQSHVTAHPRQSM